MSTTTGAPKTTGASRADELLLALARRDRNLVVVALGLGSATAWLYLARGFRSGAGMANSMTTTGAWTVGETSVQALMWVVMMVAMMLPAAIPATVVYVAVARKARRQGSPIAPASALVSGYLLVWLTFSLAATTAQWGLERLSLLSPAIASNNARFGGAVLVAAGIYQLTPLKTRCLHQCQDPGRLIANHWRAGAAGSTRMGAELGLYCLGCCWALMALLFVGGVMNLFWVAALATFILLEKLAPMTLPLRRLVATALVIGGTIAAIG